jgi:2-methylisocitrate lyase-like PEP mutase family enzyme
MVGRTVTEYIRAGVAGLHLEDQVAAKRCGHLRNKQLVSEDEYLSRIRAAVNARTKSTGDIVLIARTDALESLGFEAAVSRLKRAVEVGADVAFLEGVRSKEEAKKVCQDLAPIPVLFNAVPGGVSPDLSVEEAKQLGYRAIIFPGLALGPVYASVSASVKQLKEKGTQMSSTSNPKDLFNVVGLREAVEFDLAAGGELYSKGV